MLCLVPQSCPTLFVTPRTITFHAPLSMGHLQARILEWVAFHSPGNHSNPGIEPRSPTLPENSLPSKPPWKPKNTGVGSLSILQGNFLTQELNRGLLNRRQILYQLSYQEDPGKSLRPTKYI